MGEPPSLPGAFHDSTTLSVPWAWADTLRGALGTLARRVVAWTTRDQSLASSPVRALDAEVLPRAAGERVRRVDVACSADGPIRSGMSDQGPELPSATCSW